MQNAEGRVHGIQNRLAGLKDLLSELSKTLVDKDAKDFLLRPPTNSLGDVESYLLPQGLKAETAANTALWFDAAEFQLQSATGQMKHAQELVSRYGANLRVVGN